LKILVDFALAPDSASLDPVQEALNRWGPVNLVLVAGGSALAFQILTSAVNGGITKAWAWTGHRMVYDLAADLFEALQRRSLVSQARGSVGDSLSRLTVDTYSVYTVTSEAIVSPFQRATSLVTVGVLAWTLDPGLTLVCFATAPFLALSAWYFGPRIKRRSRSDREAQSQVASHVHRTLTSIEVVKAFGQESGSRQVFDELAQRAVDTSQQQVLTRNLFRTTHGTIVALGTAVILVAGGSRVLAGQLTVGALLVFLAYLGTLQVGMKGLLSIYSNLKSAEASVDRVLETLDTSDQIPEGSDARPLLPGTPAGQVRLDGVVFGYEPGQPVVKGISLDVSPWECVALVGATGAGKSTLVSLIPRFIDPWKGRVLLDGQDVRDCTVASVRDQVSLVLQEPFLFPVTVAKNIAYGRPSASREEVVAAAVAAQADGFIRDLPDGYNTIIAERGSTLSGGQRQRIAIARALLKDAPILILDEPTSALDVETEQSLADALELLTRERTTFIIAHRLSTVRNADRIIVLQGGELVEEGTHRELLVRGGVYAGLLKAQEEVGGKKMRT
jgi:ATP-binding cassette subfamily B protein/subfamily B ATP-binding cassette protein MsbA